MGSLQWNGIYELGEDDHHWPPVVSLSTQHFIYGLQCKNWYVWNVWEEQYFPFSQTFAAFAVFVRITFIFAGIPTTYADPVAEFIFNISKYPKQGKDSVFRVENRQVFYYEVLGSRMVRSKGLGSWSMRSCHLEAYTMYTHARMARALIWLLYIHTGHYGLDMEQS